MIVGFYQCPSPKGDMDAGFKTIETALHAASEAHVDMLVLPEAFLPGYGATPPTAPPDWSMVETRLSELCLRFETALTIGLPEYHLGQVFNSAAAFSSGGDMLARYRKIQLFGETENALYQAGNEYVVFDYLGKRWGLLICYDVEFPEHVRALAQKGAEIILVPTANMMPFVNVSEILVPSRAAENGVSIVYANYCGPEGDLTYTGLSVICGPDGYPMARKEIGTGLCVAELFDTHRQPDIPVSTQLADLKHID